MSTPTFNKCLRFEECHGLTPETFCSICWARIPRGMRQRLIILRDRARSTQRNPRWKREYTAWIRFIVGSMRPDPRNAGSGGAP